MKIHKRILGFMIAVFLFVSVSPMVVSANAGQAPNLVVIVLNAPKDTRVSLILPKDPERDTLVWKSSKIWETHFRFLYDREMRNMKGMLLLIQSSEKEFVCELPMNYKGIYEQLLTIDYLSQSLTVGQPSWRQPLLITMRVVLTLVIEGLLFFLFGFRDICSWLYFLFVNLFTQGWLNISIVEPVFEQQYWGFMFIWLEIGILIVECIVLPLIIKEKERTITVFYAISANLVSLALGGWILGNLPV